MLSELLSRGLGEMRPLPLTVPFLLFLAVRLKSGAVHQQKLRSSKAGFGQSSCLHACRYQPEGREREGESQRQSRRCDRHPAWGVAPAPHLVRGRAVRRRRRDSEGGGGQPPLALAEEEERQRERGRENDAARRRRRMPDVCGLRVRRRSIFRCCILVANRRRRVRERDRSHFGSSHPPHLPCGVQSRPAPSGVGVVLLCGGWTRPGWGWLEAIRRSPFFRQTGVSRAPSVADKYLIGIGIGLVSAVSDFGKV